MVAKQITETAAEALTTAPARNLLIGLGALFIVLIAMILLIPTVADVKRRDQQAAQMDRQFAENERQRRFIAEENEKDRRLQIEIEQTRSATIANFLSAVSSDIARLEIKLNRALGLQEQ